MHNKNGCNRCSFTLALRETRYDDRNVKSTEKPTTSLWYGNMAVTGNSIIKEISMCRFLEIYAIK